MRSGVICEKDTISYTCVSGDKYDVKEEAELTPPASKPGRGERLAWLLAEMRQLIERLQPDLIYLLRPGAGRGMTAPERREVGAVVLIAAA